MTYFTRELRPLMVRNLSRDPASRAEAITAQVDGLTPNLRLDWCAAPRTEVRVWQRVYTRDGPVEDSVENANADDRAASSASLIWSPDLLPRRATRFRTPSIGSDQLA
jgi:hypothetical protein